MNGIELAVDASEPERQVQASIDGSVVAKLLDSELTLVHYPTGSATPIVHLVQIHPIQM